MQKPGLKSVLDKRMSQKGQVEYLVLYKGQSNPQWEPIINLKKELDMLADFEVEYETKQQKKKQEQKQNEQGADNRKKYKIVDDDEEEEEYEIEEILEKRKNGGVTEYKVKWKGYSLSDCTWEPASNLENAVVALQKFQEKEQRIQIEEENKKKKIRMQEENLISQQNQREEEMELTLEDEVIEENKKGHFNTDIPDKVVAARPEKGLILKQLKLMKKIN